MHVPDFLFLILHTNYDSKYTCPSRAEVTYIDFFILRWHVPPYPRVLHFAKFYETKEDFNHVYGLSLEGIDLVVLTNKSISDIE